MIFLGSNIPMYLMGADHHVLRSRDLLLEHADLSARDALHVAVAERMGVTRILSFDRGFDAVRGLERIAD